MERTVHFVSLGCAKNRVDSERMLGLAVRQGLRPVASPEEAEVIVVNTCGFIEAAKQESIDTILELAEQKQRGRCRTLVVAGCLSQRYPDALARELPEVDHLLGTADLPRLARILAREEAEARLAVGRPEGLAEARYERHLGGPAHAAYLKISEGCNRPCAFCIIPLMRGRQRSRTVPSLVAEAEALARAGVRELGLVAQDSTAYGRDLAPRVHLAELLEALDGVAGLHWLRLHYAYPSEVDARLAEAMARLPRVAPYLDVPIQHGDDALLRRMRRGYTAARIRAMVAALRAAMPEIALRTTILCGHPGETAEAHGRLLALLEELRFDHVGVFTFSSEEGTHAHRQPDPVPAEVAEARAAEVRALQARLGRERLSRFRGRRLEVMVDGPSPESPFLWQGRHAGQAPEVDGCVILADAPRPLRPGELVVARVTDSGEHDLVASVEAVREAGGAEAVSVPARPAPAP